MNQRSNPLLTALDSSFVTGSAIALHDDVCLIPHAFDIYASAGVRISKLGFYASGMFTTSNQFLSNEVQISKTIFLACLGGCNAPAGTYYLGKMIRFHDMRRQHSFVQPLPLDG
jgi:hypothetical protein